MKKNEESKQSKMSLAAKKAWETRRKKSGKKPSKSVKKEKTASDVEEAEVLVEQLRKAYRKGELVRKGKRGHRKSSVKMTRELEEFLYGSKWFEERLLRKVLRYAKNQVKKELWPELVVAK